MGAEGWAAAFIKKERKKTEGGGNPGMTDRACLPSGQLTAGEERRMKKGPTYSRGGKADEKGPCLVYARFLVHTNRKKNLYA